MVQHANIDHSGLLSVVSTSSNTLAVGGVVIGNSASSNTHLVATSPTAGLWLTHPEAIGGSGISDQGTFTYLDATEGAAPGTPASGFARIYAKTDGRIYSKDDAGVEYGPFDAAGGGAGDPVWRTRPFMLSPYSPEAIGLELGLVMSGSPVSVNSVLSNQALFVPFIIESAITVRKMWWMNGAAVAGNVDVGIYEPDGTRLVSIGPTAQSGTNVVQEVDVADTAVAAGIHYLAIASDTSGSTQRFGGNTVTTAGHMRAFGMRQVDSLSSGTLPSSVTYAAVTVSSVILFGLSGRTLIV